MRKALSLLIALVMVVALGALTPAWSEGAVTVVIMWGVDPMAIGSGNDVMINYFNETHSDIKIVPQSTLGTSGYDTQDLSKLTAAIAAGNPPDVMNLNAPFILEVAARGVLEPLTQYVEAKGVDLDATYYAYTVKEMTFDGEIWALPSGVDSRYLYYNKQAFRDAGLDPEHPPETWAELLEYTKQLTVFDDKGDLTKIGFIPNYGNSWLYLFGSQNGGQFISDDGKKITMNDPKIVEALQFMVDGYDLVGGAEKVNAYVSTFGSGADDPFLNGTVAMVVTGDWSMSGYLRYAPDLDFGITMAPTPTGAESEKITWSGGWCYGVPRGSKKAEAAFEVIHYLTTEGHLKRYEGVDVYNKENNLATFPTMSASFDINDQLYEKYVANFPNPAIAGYYKYMADKLQNSLALPNTPVGQQLWSYHASAIDAAIYHTMTPQQALDDATRTVQRELDRFWASYKPSK